MEGDSRRLSDDELLDDECAEQWERETDDPDVLGVCADRWIEGDDWPWQVTVSAMEFVREEPLEGDLRQRLQAALSSVPNVVEVAEEDREVWVIAGEPSGDALVRAAGQVLDEFADRIGVHVGGTAVTSSPTQPVGAPVAGYIAIASLPSLRFQHREYTATAGLNEIDFVSRGGTHTLAFADPALSSFRLTSTGPTTVPSRATVELDAGKDYVIYCDLAGHHAAGEEAVIHASETTP